MLHSRFPSHPIKIIPLATVIVLVFAGFRILLWSPLSSLYLQVQGGNLLDDTLRTYHVDQALPCSFDALEDHKAQEAIANAIHLLDRAVQANPGNAQAYMLLGRSFCASGNKENAIKAYQEYIRLRPQNPLGHVELALAIIATGDRSLNPMLLADWKTAQISPELFLESANAAFLQNRHTDASQAYEQAWFLGDDFTPAMQFQWAVSAVIQEQTIPLQIPEETATIYHLTRERVRIDGSKMQWMRDHPSGSPNYGDQLGKYPIVPANIGVMWWGGQAVAFIEIDQEGSYELTIRAQHTLPAPIQIQLEADFNPIVQIELARGDLSWEEISTTVSLSSGIHLIGVNYLNNAVVDGIDRDLHIEWIELKQK